MTVSTPDNRFEWNSDKNVLNKTKHGISFEEILPVFDDPFFLERYDYRHSDLCEDRMLGIGSINGNIVVTTVFTERKRIRIISARLASPYEENVYHEYCRRLNS